LARSGHQFYGRGAPRPQAHQRRPRRGLTGSREPRRTRQFAAEAGLTAVALLAAADGAFDAHTRQTVEERKVGRRASTVTRRVAEAETAAFR